MRALLGTALCLCACGGETSLLLEVSLATGAPAPVSLRVTTYAATGRLRVPDLIPLADRGLPGTVSLRHLPAAAVPTLRVLVEGLGPGAIVTSQAAVRVELARGDQATAPAQLSGGLLPDADGDGIPDLIDDCPTTADPGQLGGSSADGGPACAGGGDGGEMLCSPGGPATACADRGYLLCDGFEDSTGASFPSWDEVILQNDQTNGAANPGTDVTVVGQPACDGQNVLHAHTAGANQQAFLLKSFAGLPNPVYLRALFDLPTSTPAIPLQLFTLTDQPGSSYLQLFFDAERSAFVVGSSFGSSAAPFPVAVTRDGWHCLEVKVVRDAQAGEVSMALDGTPVGDLAAVATQPAGVTFDTVYFGLVSASLGSDLYFDEVVISSSPIGCR